MAERLTRVPGSSDVFRGAIVAYANDVKERSSACRRRSCASTAPCRRRPRPRWRASGSASRRTSASRSPASPAGRRQDEKPVGLVYIAVSAPKSERTIEFNYRPIDKVRSRGSCSAAPGASATDTELTQTGTALRVPSAGMRRRLFCALRLPDGFSTASSPGSASSSIHVRHVPRDNLHVTLAFLGSRPADEQDAIGAALREAAAAGTRPVFEVGGYRETRSVGMLTLADEDGRAGSGRGPVRAARAAGRLPPRAASLAPARHRRPLPGASSRLRPGVPELPAFSPSDAAVYLSRLRPTGAQYVVLESFGLGG